MHLQLLSGNNSSKHFVITAFEIATFQISPDCNEKPAVGTRAGLRVATKGGLVMEGGTAAGNLVIRFASKKNPACNCKPD